MTLIAISHLQHEFAAAALVTTVLVVIYFLMLKLKDKNIKQNPRTEIIRMAEALMQDFCEHPTPAGYDTVTEFLVVHEVLMREIDPRLIERYIRVSSEGGAPTEIIEQA